MIPEYDGKKKILIFSGAGISAESGISTFRDSNGLWENYNVEDICTQSTWEKNFELVHQFYNQRRAQLNSVEPNLAHKTVAKIKQIYGDDCYVITQNVDDLFERAGCEDVLHVHGELTKMECTKCGNIWDIGYEEFDVSADICPNCSSHKGVKPYIVFFGGSAIKYRDMYRAFDICSNKDSIVVIVGTMGNVVFVEDFLRHKPCKKILNNLNQSMYLDANIFDEVYYENATTALPIIENLIYFKF